MQLQDVNDIPGKLNSLTLSLRKDKDTTTICVFTRITETHLKAAHFPQPWAESSGKDAPGRAGGADPHNPHTAACFIPKQGVLNQSWDTCQVDMMLRTTEAEWRTAPMAVAEVLSEKQLPLDSISLQGSLAAPGRPPQ